MHPLFSILIANYNNGRYLKEALDSVFSQTYDCWEIILVDDASTDESHEIYDQYKEDKRIHIHFNETNKGCGYTKRRCAELAGGALCGYLDPDDALMPNAIELMVQAHQDHPECSLIYSTCYRYMSDRTVELETWDYIGPIPEDSDFLIYQKKIVSHFVSFKRSSYLKTTGIDSSLKAAVDRDLYYRLEENGDLLYIPVPLYYYRVNNASSISIGSETADRNAYHYCIKSELNAICRRIGGPLYQKNKDAYLHYMRKILRVYYNSFLFSWNDFIRFSFHYIKAYRFSPHAVSHIYKITKGL